MSQLAGPGRVIVDSFASILRRPFVVILLLQLGIALASRTFPRAPDATGFLLEILLAVVGAYIQIATVLAAATTEPDPSTDHWIRAALARKVFWRSMITAILVFVAMVIGALFLLVGAVIALARYGLADAAAILERAKPSDAMRRSLEVTAPARRTVGWVLGILVLLPLAVFTPLTFLVDTDPMPLWLDAAGVAAVPIGLAAQIASARMFIALGGRVTRFPEVVVSKP